MRYRKYIVWGGRLVFDFENVYYGKRINYFLNRFFEWKFVVGNLGSLFIEILDLEE